MVAAGLSAGLLRRLVEQSKKSCHRTALRRDNRMTLPNLEIIARVRSPFMEKFGTPRQSGLTPAVTTYIDFLPKYAQLDSVRELRQFSHIWLVFLFHKHFDQSWHPTVRPPRLGGNQRIGVFATRSPFRPNPIGLSAVGLLSVNAKDGAVWLEVAGADLIDGTPIIDIKPYVPYADNIPAAQGGFADRAPQQQLEVMFSPTAQEQLQQFSHQTPLLKAIIRETIGLDPRPAYRQQTVDSKEYGCHLDRYNVRWRVEQKTLIVTEIIFVP